MNENFLWGGKAYSVFAEISVENGGFFAYTVNEKVCRAQKGMAWPERKQM